VSTRRSDLPIAAAGVAIAVAFALAALLGYGDAQDSVAGMVLAALGASRRYPRLTWAFVAAVTVVLGLNGSYLGGDASVAYLLMAAHGFSAGWRDSRWRGLGGPIALTAAAEFACFRHGDPPGVYVFIVGSTWLGGRALRGREQLAASLAERIDELAREEDAYAQLSVRYERARIAADLHDVVAHAISVMVIQAGAGQRLAGHDPERTRDAFAVIARAAREAENDLERLVALLADDPPTGTAPDLGLLEELVARAADSGLDVRLRLEGDTDTLTQPFTAFAHRAVQEGVTNALRYASGATVHVLVRHEPHEMLIEIENDAAGAAGPLAHDGTGNGLRGLRERAASYGGTVHAGPAPDGGWRLTARLPRRVRAGDRARGCPIPEADRI
jgi:signal transduction histidine kinase